MLILKAVIIIQLCPAYPSFKPKDWWRPILLDIDGDLYIDINGKIDDTP